MDRILNREILRLSLPSILANLTVPLVGFVDTAVSGHLQGQNAASCIGAISVGSMLFNLIYWNFGFLRTGSGGLTAQAYGRGDKRSCAKIFVRAMVLSAVAAAITLSLQLPFASASLALIGGSDEVESLARQYFLTRIWAAPATLSLMAFSGWFVGMQDSMSSMWKDLIVNGVNVAASIFLAFGAGLGFRGVALGTVIAQYSGLLFCCLVCAFKYRDVFCTFSKDDLREIFDGTELRHFFKMNADLLLRSAGFTAIYIGYTMIATTYGDTMLSCSSIMMQLLMLFSYFTDGFAYAGEALSGRFIGSRDRAMLKKSVRYIFVWSMAVAVLFVGIYACGSGSFLRVLTNDEDLISACGDFIPWLVIMPPLGCAAFTWDGIYLGATASADIRDSMLGAAVCFLSVWFALKLSLRPSGPLAIHCLLGAYFAHLGFRTVLLTARRKNVLDRA